MLSVLTTEDRERDSKGREVAVAEGVVVGADIWRGEGGGKEKGGTESDCCRLGSLGGLCSGAGE